MIYTNNYGISYASTYIHTIDVYNKQTNFWKNAQ